MKNFFLFLHLLILLTSCYVAINFIHTYLSVVVLFSFVITAYALLFGLLGYNSIVENQNFFVSLLLRGKKSKNSGMTWFMNSIKTIEDPNLRIKLFEEWQYRLVYTLIPLNLFFMCVVCGLSELRTSDAAVFSVKLIYPFTLLFFVSGISILIANYYFSSWMLKISKKTVKEIRK